MLKATLHRSDPEHYEQVFVINWCCTFKQKHKALKLIYATPNARKCTPRQGKWLNDEGRKKGVPDLCLPYPKIKEYRLGVDGIITKEIVKCGLYIEMKYGKNKTSPEQKEWLKDLKEAHYNTAICYSGVEAIKIICTYLGIVLSRGEML